MQQSTSKTFRSPTDCPIPRVRRTGLLSNSSVEKSLTNVTSHASISVGKKASVLPSVACEMGRSIHQDSAMYINEFLTQHRSELFGRLNKFKKENKYKFPWTNNGKIYLRKPHGHLHLQHLKNLKTSLLHQNETFITV